jgi:hypothetical protein
VTTAFTDGVLLAHPTRTRHVYMRATTPDAAPGIYRSTDAGTSWTRLTSVAGELLTADYGTGRLLWAVDGCLRASTDDGSTWTPLAHCGKIFLPVIQGEPPQPINVVQVATSPALPNVLLVNRWDPPRSWLNPIYSTDAGKTWHVFPLNPWLSSEVSCYDGLAVIVTPRDDGAPRFLVVCYHSQAESFLIYRTGDYGASWSELRMSFTQFKPNTLVTSRANPKRIYYVASSTIMNSPDSRQALTTLHTSANSGVQWNAVVSLDFEIEGSLGAAVPSPVLPNRVYLLINSNPTGFRWVRSDEIGAQNSWVSKTIASQSLALDAQDPSRLYIPGFTSADEGQTWQPWGTTVFTNGVLLAHPTRTRHIYMRATAPSAAAGIYRSTDAGASWERLTSVAGELLTADYGTGRLLWVVDGCLKASTDDGSTWTALATQCT